jgi:hypothetical protein
MTHEEYPVHPSKTEFEALLLAEAERLGCRQATRKARLGCLARYCSTPDALARAGEVAPLAGSTLWRNLAQAHPPEWPTLHRLVAGTGIPLVRWLLALRCTSLDEVASVLERESAALRLDAAERAVLDEVRWLPAPWRRWCLEVVLDTVRRCPLPREG